MFANVQIFLGLFSTIVVLGLLLAGLMGLAFVVWLLIWPVERRAQDFQAPFRFRLIDLGCLLVYWQVILATVAALDREVIGNALGTLLAVALIVIFVSLLTWGVCVNVLARAGIESSARRAAFILVCVPGAIAAAVSFVVSGAVAVISIFHWLAEPTTAIPDMIPTMIFVATCGTIVLLRLVSRWIAADSCRQTNGNAARLEKEFP